MSNKSISFLAALMAVTTILSSFSLVVAATETKPTENTDNNESISADISKEIEEITKAEETRDVISDFSLVITETKSAENPDVTESISADISKETEEITEAEEAKSVEVIGAEALKISMPVVAIASKEDSEMIAQVIIIKNDGTDDTEESDISAIKPGESYTFEISNLNITSDNLGGFCLTFDFGEHPNFFEENVEKINIDVNNIKIDGVEFNIDSDRKNLDESDYNNGFALFPLISADSEHFNEVFFTDSETSEAGKVAESISVGITVNQLVLKEDDSNILEKTTTTATETTESTKTTTTTETTTKITESTKVTTATTVASTTKATTTTTNDGNNVIPPTADSGVGAAEAVLATSASFAFVIKKRKK